MSNKKRKINLMYLILAILLLASSVAAPVMDIVRADEIEEKAKRTFEDEKEPEEIREEDEEKKKDFLEALQDEGYGDSVDTYGEKLESSPYLKYKDFTIPWYVQHIFSPGQYIYNVGKGTKVEGDGDDYDDTMVTGSGEDKNVCNHPNEPQNVLNHNCDIPTFGSELFQTILKPRYPTGVRGAERTSSVAGWGFGVPVGIPGDEVPADPRARNVKYTALELYGYHLPYTVYSGEWDEIQVSTAARLIANVGAFGKLKILAAGVWNGISNVLNKFTSNWTFNPFKWSRRSPGFADGVVATVVDTSDMYVASTRAWKRPTFSNTLYNAYYMSDKEVIETSFLHFKKFLREHFYKIAKAHPRLQEIIYLSPPLFDGSFKAQGRTWHDETEFPKYDYMAHRKCKRYVTYTDENGVTHETEECAVWETEQESFARWKREPYQVEYDARGKAKEIDCFDDASLYSELIACWTPSWEALADKELNHELPMLERVSNFAIETYLSTNPMADPNKAISHYVQADEEGNPIGGTDKGSWKYIYTGENTRSSEFVNPGAKPIRPSIRGALFGNGMPNLKQPDTRYEHFIKNINNPISNGSAAASFGRTVSKFFAKATNTLISFSFANIIQALKLDKLTEIIVDNLREGLFFPLSGLFIAFTAVYAFFKSGTNPRGTFNSILWVITALFIGVFFLMQPGKLITAIETVPNKIDNFLADTILPEETQNQICTATGSSEKIRSMQCSIWEITVFTPWLRGQWGTNYNSLNANNFNNRNKDLVGDAAVDMGGGHTENNWALYQLSKMKTGTITTEDPSSPEGVMSKSMYKIVDLQAGPNGGELSDGKYFSVWSGESADNRGMIQMYSAIVSVFMFIVIGGLSVAKIELTLFMIIKLMFLPIYMLKALGPNSKGTLLNLFNEWFSLFAKRVLVTIVLLLSLAILTAVINTDLNYTTMALFIVATLFTIKVYHKEIINLITSAGNAANEGIGSLKNKISKEAPIPKSARQSYAMRKEALKQGLSGAAGGAVAGIAMATSDLVHGRNEQSAASTTLGAIKQGLKESTNRVKAQMDRRHRLEGRGFVQTLSRSAEAGVSNTNVIDRAKETRKDMYDDELRTAINFKLAEALRRQEAKDISAEERYQAQKEAEHYKELLTQVNYYIKGRDLGITPDKKLDKYRDAVDAEGLDKLRSAVFSMEISKLLDRDDRKLKNITVSSNNINDSSMPYNKIIDELLEVSIKNTEEEFDPEPYRSDKFNSKEEIENKVRAPIRNELDRISLGLDENQYKEYQKDLNNYYIKLQEKAGAYGKLDTKEANALIKSRAAELKLLYGNVDSNEMADLISEDVYSKIYDEPKEVIVGEKAHVDMSSSQQTAEQFEKSELMREEQNIDKNTDTDKDEDLIFKETASAKELKDKISKLRGKLGSGSDVETLQESTQDLIDKYKGNIKDSLSSDQSMYSKDKLKKTDNIKEININIIKGKVIEKQLKKEGLLEELDINKPKAEDYKDKDFEARDFKKDYDEAKKEEEKSSSYRKPEDYKQADKKQKEEKKEETKQPTKNTKKEAEKRAAEKAKKLKEDLFEDNIDDLNKNEEVKKLVEDLNKSNYESLEQKNKKRLNEAREERKRKNKDKEANKNKAKEDIDRQDNNSKSPKIEFNDKNKHNNNYNYKNNKEDKDESSEYSNSLDNNNKENNNANNNKELINKDNDRYNKPKNEDKYKLIIEDELFNESKDENNIDNIFEDIFEDEKNIDIDDILKRFNNNEEGRDDE